MKKYIYSIMMAAAALFSFSSCEDVPNPYDLPEKPETPETPAAEPTGTGTQADPFNVAGALKYIEDGGSEDAEVYVKGKVVSVKDGSYDANYGSLKYYISDDGTTSNQFYVFNGYAGPNRTKFSGEDALKPGDEVVICGKLVNYNGTKEFTTGNYVVTVNGQPIGGGSTPDTPTTNPKGSGTAADPFNVDAALKYIEDGGSTTAEVYVKGKVSKVVKYNDTYKSINYNIVDENSNNELEVYSGKGLDGADFTSINDLKVGQIVTICGKLKDYNGTKEFDKTSKIVKIEGTGEETGGDTGDASAANGDFENWTNGKPNNWATSSTAGNATLSQSTDAHGGKYSVKVAGNASANKRLGYKEMELKAGKYVVKFYAKAATATGASARPGFVPVTDGKVGNYVYGEYTNGLTNSQWVLIEYTAEIPSDGTYCFVIMNSKNPGGDLLIDDFSVTFNGSAIIK